MKKTIFIEFLLLFVFIWLIYGTFIWWRSAYYWIIELKRFIASHTPEELYTVRYSFAGLKADTARAVTCAVFSTLATLSTLAAMIIIAIKDFPVFKPLVDKINAKREAKAVAKAEKAEADKQARIEQLQAELDELKKDE